MQFSSLLRYGSALSELAYQRWLTQLDSAAQEKFLHIMNQLRRDHSRIAPDQPDKSPWHNDTATGRSRNFTCLFEIAELIKTGGLE